jgi:hypothetical protein
MTAFLARRACLGLALAFANVAFAAGPAAVSLEVGQDRMGGDYKGFALAQPDAEQCRQACADDEACQAFTYVNPGIKGPEAMCFLKSSAVPATADACCTSGAKALVPLATGVRATAPPVILSIPILVGKSAQQIAAEHAAAEKAKDDAYEANQKFLQEGYEAAADEAQKAHDQHQCEVLTAAAVAPAAASKQAYDEWLAASGAVSKALNAFLASIDTAGVCDSGGCDDAYYLANYPQYQQVLDLVPAAQSLKAKADEMAKPAEAAHYAAWQACHP